MSDEIGISSERVSLNGTKSLHCGAAREHRQRQISESSVARLLLSTQSRRKELLNLALYGSEPERSWAITVLARANRIGIVAEFNRIVISVLQDARRFTRAEVAWFREILPHSKERQAVSTRIHKLQCVGSSGDRIEAPPARKVSQ